MYKSVINVMVDLETVGTSSYSGILAIGAIPFNCPQPLETFYEKASFQSLELAGFNIDKATLDWWSKQPQAARVEAFSGTKDIELVLHDFASYLSALKETTGCEIVLWGNGSDFDNALLTDAYDKFGIKLPWKYTNNRCFRTLKNLFSHIKHEFVGMKHNALEDARNQAIHATKIFIELERVGAI